MSKALAPRANFVAVLRAVAQKNEAPALIVGAVTDAAIAYAKNGGAKNLINSVIDACTTTATGKARTPAPGTAAALVLSAMRDILATAADAGARPDSGADVAARDTLAAAYGATIGARFTEATEAAAAARKAAAEARKAKATDPEPAPADDVAGEGKADAPADVGPAVTGVDYKARAIKANARAVSLARRLRAARAEIRALKAVQTAVTTAKTSRKHTETLPVSLAA